ncbi:MAG TPA: hypothetical protein ENN31_00225, partial [Candidatus Vogelbacteria bacterium]|nr:hypothetical protein [Candidatus Vogelbacteria bacterium]
MKKIIKKILPKNILNSYHYLKARLASFYYNHPSEKMIVIGIVGSKGKTTTANLLWYCLDEAGYLTGLTGTANLKFGQKEELNKYHMTMPGPFILQQHLKKMADSGCQFAIVETPSEGQTQFRHIGINYDLLIYTNLTDEKVEAHNFSLKILNKHNARVFRIINKLKRKTIAGKKIEKTIIVNADDRRANEYLRHPADRKISFGLKNEADFVGLVEDKPDGLELTINQNEKYFINLPGTINGINSLAAIVAAKTIGLTENEIKKSLNKNIKIPGRMEEIKNNKNLNIIVDYAHEQVGLKALLDWAKKNKKNGRVIVLIGAEGGGRDKEKRPLMGKIAGQLAEIVIVANVDPYDDNPEEIINDIILGIKETNCSKENYYSIPDRRLAIRKALQLAKSD